MSHLRAGATFDALDQAAKDLLTELAQDSSENIEWPEDHQPKHHPKNGNRFSCVTYDKRTRRYTTINPKPSQVSSTEIVKIDLGNNSAIHYCYHPVEEEYILYKPPNGFQANYMAIATVSHIIKMRDITVTTLLAFATQSANTASKTLKNDIKEAVTEETIKAKILNYRLYIDLIETIVKLVDCIIQRDAIVKVDDKITEINTLIEFMNNKNVSPKCKQLKSTITAEQFTAAHNDTRIMEAAKQALTEDQTNEQLKNEWKNHTEAHRRTQDKNRLMELMSARYAHLLAEEKPPKENGRDIETSSEASFVSSATASTHLISERSHKPSFRPSDLTKEILDNIPMFDGKPSELNQFINTIETVANIYNIPEIQMVLLRTRGKPHEIITHVIEDDPAAGWEGIKRKLTSNYGATKSRMDAGIQLKNMAMKENETLGEYLARARTLFKAKLKLDTQWDEEYDPFDMWYIVNGLTLTHVKNRISKKLNTYKSYKQCFDHIEEEWEKTHYLDGEYTNQTSSEVNEIQEWEETPTDDPQNQAFQAEVNEVFQRYGRHYNNYQPHHQGSNSYRPQYNRFNQNRNGRFSSNRFNTPRHQSTTVANQAYTFNSTTTHPNVSYAPGTLNMGPMHQQWGYQNQPYHSQYGNKQQTPAFNSFTQSNTQTGTKSTPDNTGTIIEQMVKLLSSLKAQTHQVQEIQAQTTSETWDLSQATELPQTTTDSSE